MVAPFSVTISCQGSAIRLAVEGEVDIATAGALLAGMEGAINCDVERVDVDLSQVSFFDSSGVDALVIAHGAARRQPSLLGYTCQLWVVRPARQVETALRAAGEHGYLNIVPGYGPESV